ncbi:hypothetical protein [Haliangium sp.]|uniref:hypothetical protein n=1 Tax=Haliangium sp. TaxID=2663208 RepID=UPI003D0A54D9
MPALPRTTTLRRLALSALVLVLSGAGLGCATGGVEDADARVKDPGQGGPDAGQAQSPYGVELYLRGTFNDFGTDQPLRYEGQNRFTAELPLAAGAHEFKVADEGYSDDTTFALDPAQASALELDTPRGLQRAAGLDNNVLLFVPRTGTYRFELSAVDRAAPVLLVSLVAPAPYQPTLFVRGSFNGFDLSGPLRYLGQGRYAAELVLEAGDHQFKIADESFSDMTTFAVDAAAPATLAVGESTRLVPAPGAGNEVQITVAATGVYEFALTVDDPNAPSLLVSQRDLAPYAEALFVRGSFNDFDLSTPMRYQGGGRYLGEVLLDSGSYQFKLADEAFSDRQTFSVSAGGQVAIAIDAPTLLVPASAAGNETVLELSRPGVYGFELSASAPDAPVLTVRATEPAPYEVELYVRGSFNDFDAVDRMSYVNRGRYEVVLSLPAGAHGFKIADASFDNQLTFSVDSTRQTQVQPNIPTELELAPGEDNNTLFTIDTPSDYRFALTVGDDPTTPVLLITEELPVSTQ